MFTELYTNGRGADTAVPPGGMMDDSFKTRESQFEAKFAHDEELKFKIVAHRNKLFAAWVADQMGEAAPPGYADSFVESALGRSPEDLVAKAMQDLHDHGVALADTKLRKAFEQFDDQAQTEVMKEVAGSA